MRRPAAAGYRAPMVALALALALAALLAPAYADEDLLTPDNAATHGALASIPTMPPFSARIEPLPFDVVAKMEGVTWRAGCPVALDQLSLLTLSHWGLDGQVHQGRLIVATAHAEAVQRVFERLFASRFPVQSVRPAHEFGGDDDVMMRANNTSAFNCRPVAGGKRYSDHSYGHALDLNPLINPYVRGAKVDPAQGRAYLDRDPNVPGIVVDPGPVVDAFAEQGWKWGGHWQSAKDYQHFSVTGR